MPGQSRPIAWCAELSGLPGVPRCLPRILACSPWPPSWITSVQPLGQRFFDVPDNVRFFLAKALGVYRRKELRQWQFPGLPVVVVELAQLLRVHAHRARHLHVRMRQANFHRASTQSCNCAAMQGVLTMVSPTIWANGAASAVFGNHTQCESPTLDCTVGKERHQGLTMSQATSFDRGCGLAGWRRPLRAHALAPHRRLATSPENAYDQAAVPANARPAELGQRISAPNACAAVCTPQAALWRRGSVSRALLAARSCLRRARCPHILRPRPHAFDLQVEHAGRVETQDIALGLLA